MMCLSQIEEQLRVSAHDQAGEGWTLTLPIHIKSEQNASRNWGVKHSRAEKERQTVANALWHRELITKAKRPELPVRVTLTRIASCKLDAHDTLPYGFKAVADAVAKWLGVKDNDPRIDWQYEQEKPTKAMRAAAPMKITAKGLKRARVYAARIQIEEVR